MTLQFSRLFLQLNRQFTRLFLEFTRLFLQKQLTNAAIPKHTQKMMVPVNPPMIFLTESAKE